jgi:hypothetical protein
MVTVRAVIVFPSLPISLPRRYYKPDRSNYQLWAGYSFETVTLPRRILIRCCVVFGWEQVSTPTPLLRLKPVEYGWRWHHRRHQKKVAMMSSPPSKKIPAFLSDFSTLTVSAVHLPANNHLPIATAHPLLMRDTGSRADSK